MQRIGEVIRRHGHDRPEPFADAIDALGKEDVEAMQEEIVPSSEASNAADEREKPFLVQTDNPRRGTDGEDDPQMGLCIPYLLGQQSGSVARDVTKRPAPTIATRGAIGLYRPEAFVLPRNGFHRGLHSNPGYNPHEQPLHTITAKNHDGHIVSPYLVPFYSERAGQNPRIHDVEEPLPTVTATGSQPAVTQPYLIQYHGNSDSRSLDEPLPTVTTRDSLALCLPEHYPWGLNIRFRMLQPRELAAAMGFPPDYQFTGNKTETVEQIGNAVPVNLAKSLVERLLVGRDPTLGSFGGDETAIADGGSRPRTQSQR